MAGTERDAEAVVETLHGLPVSDPFRWLEDGEDSRVRSWSAARAREARAWLDARPGREAIRRRLEESLSGGSLGRSVPRGGKRFFTRRAAGHDQPAIWVAEGGEERRLLEPEGGTTALDWWYVARDGSLLCYGLSEDGGEDSTLCLLRVADGGALPDRIPHCKLAAVAFEPDLGAILYTRYPDPVGAGAEAAQYERRVWRHVLGTDVAGDVKLFGDTAEATAYVASISISRSGEWTVVAVAHGWQRVSVHLRRGEGPFVPIFDGPEALVEPWFAGDRLLALTDWEAPRGRLVEIDPDRPQPGHWATVVAEGEATLVGAAVHQGGLLVQHLREVSSAVTACAPDGTPLGEVPLPPHATVTGLGADPEVPDAYLTVESFVLPPRTTTLGGGVVDALPLPAGFEPDRHPVRQVWYRSADGTRVPMFLVGRAEGTGATWLTGYGGFNVSRVPSWSPALVPFLESGGLFCLANLRGGGEFGENWHRSGMLEQKQHVFDDFLAAAQWLVDAGLTRPRQLGIIGGSNGGLLVGAAMTQRPDLFGGVVCQVALLDMVRYERFKVARLWAAEYGSADDPEQFSWLYGYSPYHHVRDGVDYPPILLTAGEEDARVDGMHARKMAARLRQANAGGTVLLRVEARAGHGQGKPVSKIVAEETDIQSFLGSVLG
ncbi:MAG: prolyl oligopeptidase family serine peptidase [Candidatus Dormibacteraceae bacterium]